MPDATIRRFFDALRSKGLALDTNMWILYIVGLYDENAIEVEDRTQKYTKKEYGYIQKLINESKTKQISLSSYSVPEITHLLDIESNHRKKNGDIEHSKYLDTTILQLTESLEHHRSAKEIKEASTIDEIALYGFCDLSLQQIAKDGYAILTDDMQLNDYLQSNNLPSISMQILRAIDFSR